MKSDKLIIFDCDGVLVDSEPLAALAYENTFARHGFVIERAVFEQCVGMKQADILSKIEDLTGYSLPDINNGEIWTETKIQFGKFLKPTNGLTDFLKRFSAPGCIASSSSLERIGYSIDITGLRPFFPEKYIYSSSMVRHGKPAPDLFLHAAKSSGFSPENCVVIEDSHYGVQGAVAAGMTAVGFTGGGHSDATHGVRLLAHGAVAACSGWVEVADVLSLRGFI